MTCTNDPSSSAAPSRRRVGLFVTCLVDLFRPSVGFAAVKLLEDAGCRVEIPHTQTCCGQPAYNNGDRANTRAIAREVVKAFECFDYVVVPSGSCAGTLRRHYPGLLADDLRWTKRANALAEKVYELISFLTDVCGVDAVNARFESTATYHDSCSGLRELDIRHQPRRLLASVIGLELREMEDSNVCCGFGGTFSVKYPDISNAIVEKKTRQIDSTEADLVLAGDLGCLMNIAGKLSREGRTVAARHVAEVLAGMTEELPIGVSEPTRK